MRPNGGMECARDRSLRRASSPGRADGRVLGALVPDRRPDERIQAGASPVSSASQQPGAPPPFRSRAVIEAGICAPLTNLLRSTSIRVVTPVLRTLGNIVTGNDTQTQAVIDAGALQPMLPLVQHAKKGIRKEACWLLSNVAAGSAAQISALMNTPNVVPGVVHQLESGDWDVRKEAAWVISNIALGGSQQHLRELVEYRPIRPLCDLLEVADSKIVKVALDTLEAVLKVEGLQGTVLIDEADGLEKIEALQRHENDDIYKHAVRIIETYFGEDDAEDETAELRAGPASPPATAPREFAFGGPVLGASPAFAFYSDPRLQPRAPSCAASRRRDPRALKEKDLPCSLEVQAHHKMPFNRGWPEKKSVVMAATPSRPRLRWKGCAHQRPNVVMRKRGKPRITGRAI